MSRKFYAVNRETGERWKPRQEKDEYLVMYDSGYLAVVDASDYYLGLSTLDPKIWEVVMNFPSAGG